MPEELEGEFVLNKNQPPKTQIKENETQAATPAATITFDSAFGKANNAKFYSSLCLLPNNIKFENQEKDEIVVLLIRRDLITNVPWIATAIVLSLIPPFLSLFPNLLTPFFTISGNTLMFVLLFYYLVIFGFVLGEFAIWYFTVGLITNKRVIDLDLHGILSKHVSETRLNLVEDVSYTQVGSIRSIFNYGDVLLQTAGTLNNFEFDRAPEPARIVRIIADMIGRHKK